MSACSSTAKCSECGQVLNVSTDTYVMWEGTALCGKCAAWNEIAVGIGDNMCRCDYCDEVVPQRNAVNIGTDGNGRINGWLCGVCYKQYLEDNGENYSAGFYDGQCNILENYVILSEAVDELQAIGREDAIDALREIYDDDTLTSYPRID